MDVPLDPPEEVSRLLVPVLWLVTRPVLSEPERVMAVEDLVRSDEMIEYEVVNCSTRWRELVWVDRPAQARSNV